MKRIILCLIGIFACSASVFAPNAGALTFFDDFSGSSINPFYWTPGSSGITSVTQTGGRLIMTQADANGGASLTFNFTISGDFQVQVDYKLVDWPSSNYERVGLGASGIGLVQRSQHPGWFGEAYVTHFWVGDGVHYTPPTTDTEGKLQLVRSGNTITGSYWNGTGWTAIRSLSYPPVGNDTNIGLNIWNGYTSERVAIAFDNFYLNAPGTANPVPLPAGILLLAPGLAGLVGIRRRFKK